MAKRLTNAQKLQRQNDRAHKRLLGLLSTSSEIKRVPYKKQSFKYDSINNRLLKLVQEKVLRAKQSRSRLQEAKLIAVRREAAKIRQRQNILTQREQDAQIDKVTARAFNINQYLFENNKLINEFLDFKYNDYFKVVNEWRLNEEKLALQHYEVVTEMVSKVFYGKPVFREVNHINDLLGGHRRTGVGFEEPTRNNRIYYGNMRQTKMKSIDDEGGLKDIFEIDEILADEFTEMQEFALMNNRNAFQDKKLDVKKITRNVIDSTKNHIGALHKRQSDYKKRWELYGRSILALWKYVDSLTGEGGHTKQATSNKDRDTTDEIRKKIETQINDEETKLLDLINNFNEFKDIFITGGETPDADDKVALKKEEEKIKVSESKIKILKDKLLGVKSVTTIEKKVTNVDKRIADFVGDKNNYNRILRFLKQAGEYFLKIGNYDHIYTKVNAKLSVEGDKALNKLRAKEASELGIINKKRDKIADFFRSFLDTSKKYLSTDTVIPGRFYLMTDAYVSKNLNHPRYPYTNGDNKPPLIFVIDNNYTLHKYRIRSKRAVKGILALNLNKLTGLNLAALILDIIETGGKERFEADSDLSPTDFFDASFKKPLRRKCIRQYDWTQANAAVITGQTYEEIIELAVSKIG